MIWQRNRISSDLSGTEKALYPTVLQCLVELWCMYRCQPLSRFAQGRLTPPTRQLAELGRRTDDSPLAAASHHRPAQPESGVDQRQMAQRLREIAQHSPLPNIPFLR